jgi:hypothetical protein
MIFTRGRTLAKLDKGWAGLQNLGQRREEL